MPMRMPMTGEEWAAFEAEQKARRDAEVANGHVCRRCGAWIFRWKYPGHPQECVDCMATASDEECTHSSFLRCPACGHQWDWCDHAPDDLLEEGKHPVDCPECEFEFEVITRVQYHFTSPARASGSDEEE